MFVAREEASSRFAVTRQALDWLAARLWRQFLAILLFALLIRGAAFGDPALYVDEGFYALVGDMMHHGAIPYVDVWDRKPPGLFVLYYLFAGVLAAPLGYQIAAWLFASVTAFLIARLAQGFAGPRAGLLAAFVYLAGLDTMYGIGGQTPVFYNLFVCAAYFLVIRSLPRLRASVLPNAVIAAMLLAGTAITIKQTSAFEAAFLGLFVVFVLIRAGLPLRRLVPATLGFIALGLLPTAIFVGWYVAAGHWDAFYSAVVTSSINRPPPPILTILKRTGSMLFGLSPFLVLAGYSIWYHVRTAISQPLRALLFGWMIAAIVGVISVPALYPHYALPLFVPLSLLSAPALARPKWGAAAVIVLAGFGVLRGHAFDFWRYAESRSHMADLAAAMAGHSPNGTALVFDGPSYLYALSGLEPASMLVFPSHVNRMSTPDVVGFDVDVELAALLAKPPGTVVRVANPDRPGYSSDAFDAVTAYVSTSCTFITERHIRDTVYQVFGDCRDGSETAGD